MIKESFLIFVQQYSMNHSYDITIKSVLTSYDKI